MAISKKFKPKRLLGIDIDAALIEQVFHSLLHCITSILTYQYFPKDSH
jgi:hypothetical protein